MTSACIVYENLSDAGTLTASSSQLLTPVLNLQNEHVKRRWSGATDGGDSFVCSFGSLTSVDTVGVFGIIGDTARIRLSSVDVTGAAGDLYDSGVLNVDQDYLSVVDFTPAVVSAGFLRVDLTGNGNVQVGRLVSGVKRSFAYNFSKGWQRQWVDRSVRKKTRGGQTQISPDDTYRTASLSFDFLTLSDRNGFVETVDRVNASKKDVLFVFDPDSTNLARDSIWGLMTATTPVVQTFHNAFTKSYSIEERL